MGGESLARDGLSLASEPAASSWEEAGGAPTLSIHLLQKAWFISSDIWLDMARKTGVLLTMVRQMTDMYAAKTPGWHYKTQEGYGGRSEQPGPRRDHCLRLGRTWPPTTWFTAWINTR